MAAVLTLRQIHELDYLIHERYEDQPLARGGSSESSPVPTARLSGRGTHTPPIEIYTTEPSFRGDTTHSWARATLHGTNGPTVPEEWHASSFKAKTLHYSDSLLSHGQAIHDYAGSDLGFRRTLSDDVLPPQRVFGIGIRPTAFRTS